MTSDRRERLSNGFAVILGWGFILFFAALIVYGVFFYEEPRAAPTRNVARTDKGSCHPSYVGQCLDPDLYDYDSGSGTGDGPGYVRGTVRIVGYDEYDLDRDGDNLGCDP